MMHRSVISGDHQAELSGVRPFEFLDMETLRKGTTIVDSAPSVFSCQTETSTLPYRHQHDDSAYTTLASHYQTDEYYDNQVKDASETDFAEKYTTDESFSKQTHIHSIGQVNEYPKMHYFGLPIHTQSMIAYKFLKFQ